MNLVSLVLLCVIAVGSVTASGAERPLLHPEKNFLVFKKRPRPSQTPEAISIAARPIRSSASPITSAVDSALGNLTKEITPGPEHNQTSDVSHRCPTCDVPSAGSDALSIASVVPLMIVGLIYLCLGVKLVLDCRRQAAKRYRQAHDDLMLVTTVRHP